MQDLYRVPLNIASLHAKYRYTRFRPCGFGEEFSLSHYKPMVNNDAPGRGHFSQQLHGWQDL